MTDRAYTVRELIADLAKLPQHLPVKLEDADTAWTIPTFTIELIKSTTEDLVYIRPCAYSDMESPS